MKPSTTLAVHAAAAVALAASLGCPQAPCPTVPAEAPATPSVEAEPLLTVAGGLEGTGEGMWSVGRLDMLDEADMEARGIEFPLSRLWTPGEGGLASASIHLGGCTASLVSPDGLIVTNHHCAYGAISRNSTPERNLLDDGFVAESRAAELPGHRITAKVLQGFTDVTDRVAADLPDDPAERVRAIERREAEVVGECEARPGRRCHVARFEDGVPYGPLPEGAATAVRRFVLFETLELKDVRLVANPPSGVGEYGGEVDNWHWPRHVGDWSFLRAYVGPDGEPAEPADENVPYHPAHWLQVSVGSRRPGDPVLVLGYPGATERYQTAVEVTEAQQWLYPLRLALFSEWIAALEEASERSDEARLLNAPMLRGIHNGRSHAIGMIAALERSGVLAARRAEEDALRAWAAADPSRARTVEALDGLAAVVAQREATRDRDHLLRYLARISQVLGFARTITKWAVERPKDDLDREPGYQDRDEEVIRRNMESAEKSLDLEGDRLVLLSLLRRAAALPDDRRLEPLDEALGEDRSEAALAAFVERLYAGTTLGDTEARLGMLGTDLATLEASEDEMIRFALALDPALQESTERSKRLGEAIAGHRPVLVAGLAAFRGRPQYPDANGTLRLSVGSVRGYVPGDGAAYVPFSTAAGLIEKETGQEPFASPAAVLDAIRRGDFGRWGDPRLGSLPVNFLSDNDTTGGNSGSPALDGNGELIGLLFDGVWEDLAGDFSYNPVTTRSILVDIRYVLWYLDRIAHATSLLEELGVGE